MSQRLVGTAVSSDSRVAPRSIATSVALLAVVVVLFLRAGEGVYLAGALGFLVALLVSVCLHEGGHFLTARHYGMKATQFFVGFGPTLFSRRRGETEYGVKAIPAGGFVKIVGMTPLEEVEPGDEDRVFYRAPVRQKVVVLAAGSTMHFLICAALVLGGTFALGAQREQAPAVGAVSRCVASDPATPAATTAAAPTTPVDPCTLPGSVPAPAQAAGLEVGDVVTRVAGVRVDSAEAFVKAVRAAPAGQSLLLEVRRDGRSVPLRVDPVLVSRNGLDGVPGRSTISAIGIAPSSRIGVVRLGPADSLRESGSLAVAFLTGIRDTVTEKLGSITKIYSKDRDPEGFIGIVGAGRISGEVLASQETGGVKALRMVLIVASLNLFVGLFNLLPLLPLDGGHIAVALYEGARDKVKRGRGYRGPFQRVDYTKLLPVTYGVAGLFLLFTIALLGADIVNPISINS